MSLDKIVFTLNVATGMTEERLLQFPDYGVYIHTRDQIDFIEKILGQGSMPNQQEKDFVNIALMAIKELDASEPEYSDALCELSYQFKELTSS